MKNRDSILSKPIKIKNWKFDKNVSKVFKDMIYRSIPGYSNIIRITGIISKKFARPNTNIYDLGCALGESTYIIYKKVNIINCCIIAIDNSPHMILRCKNRIKFLKKKMNIKIIKGDICKQLIKNASVIVLNFTLQFINPIFRQKLLNRIYKNLNFGGVLLLSEKFYFQNLYIKNLLNEMHFDFKRINGYSKLEINQKRKMLKNIMKIDTIEKHKERLINSGFKHIGIIYQNLNFGSLIAIKER